MVAPGGIALCALTLRHDHSCRLDNVQDWTMHTHDSARAYSIITIPTLGSRRAVVHLPVIAMPSIPLVA
jgi:hypothetical protein